jgi:hypothetical protein
MVPAQTGAAANKPRAAASTANLIFMFSPFLNLSLLPNTPHPTRLRAIFGSLALASGDPVNPPLGDATELTEDTRRN